MKRIIMILILFALFMPIVKAETIDEKINTLLTNVANLDTEIDNLNNIDKLYPIGSIYITTTATNPSTIFGGTWVAYSQGRQLVGVGSNGISSYSYNATGGSSTVKLTSANLPAHNHTITPTGTVASTFTGNEVITNSTGSHTHIVPFGLAVEEAAGFGLIWNIDRAPAFTDRVLVSGFSTVIDSAGSHTHTITPTGTVTSTFTGSEVTTSSVGNSNNLNIQNPYITVYMWKRTA